LNVFVDTSIWSLAFRRDASPDLPEIHELRRSLDAGAVYCTGLVLQKLLQGGFSKPKAHKQIVERFAALPLLVPDRDKYTRANRGRENGQMAGNGGAWHGLYRLRPVVSSMILVTMNESGPASS
jgi:hypothetical protein